jgi:uncharacterized Zn-binding protein involved in type VI secretion
MSNYIKATNFAAKDTYTTGNPLKTVSGVEIDDEFTSIQTSVYSKADTSSPTLTGTPTAPTAASGTNTTQVATTAFVQAAIPTVRTAGRVAAMSGSGTVDGGSGWTYSWSGSECTVTHNLSTWDYTLILTVESAPSGAVTTVSSRGTTTFKVKPWNSVGTNVSAFFNFILIAD